MQQALSASAPAAAAAPGPAPAPAPTPVPVPAPEPAASDARRVALKLRVAWRFAGWASRLPFAWRWRLARHLAEKSMSGPSPGLELMVTNLELCLPEWQRDERVALFDSNATETVFAFLEQFRCWSLSERELRAEVSIENLSILLSARSRGPVVITCPHFFGAEFAAHRISLETPGALVYTAAPHPAFDALRQQARERFGTCRSILQGGSMLPLVREMRRGAPVFLLSDLDPGPVGSIFTPFFGQLAATSTGPAWCAARFGAAVIPISVRRSEGGKYIITVHPPVQGLDADVEAGTAKVNAVIERLVRDNPVQYWWAQPRFATRPAGAPPVYSPTVLAFVRKT